MIQYPSITTKIINTPIYAYEKIDGSLIRAEYSPKRGIYKFGSRHHLIDETEPILGKAVPLIKELEEDLTNIVSSHYKKVERIVFFFEYFGIDSRFGSHNPDNKMNVALIDVHVHKRGLILPEEYYHLFHCQLLQNDLPALLYKGLPDEDFIKSIKYDTKGGFSQFIFEGVVCKGVENDRPVMFKVKTLAWLQKLARHCGNDEEKFKKLS